MRTKITQPSTLTAALFLMVLSGAWARRPTRSKALTTRAAAEPAFGTPFRAPTRWAWQAQCARKHHAQSIRECKIRAQRGTWQMTTITGRTLLHFFLGTSTRAAEVRARSSWPKACTPRAIHSFLPSSPTHLFLCPINRHTLLAAISQVQGRCGDDGLQGPQALPLQHLVAAHRAYWHDRRRRKPRGAANVYVTISAQTVILFAVIEVVSVRFSY